MLVLGLLEKMEQWLDPTTANAAVGGFAAASSADPGLGGFLAAALTQVEQFFDQANLDAAIDLPRQLWDMFLNDALKLMLPFVAKFVVKLVAAFTPTGAAVIAWVTQAVAFYNAVKEYIDSGKLTATINGLKEVFGDVVGSIDPERIGQKISDLVQANLPVVFSLLAAAVGAGGIEKIPGKVIDNVKKNWKDPAVKFLTGLTKPVLKRVNNLFGKDKNKKLTTPVKLRNFPDCTGWLAVNDKGKVRVFISCSPDVEQPSDDPSIRSIEDLGKKIKPKAEKVKQSGAKRAEAVELLGYKRQADEKIKELTPKGQCAVSGGAADDCSCKERVEAIRKEGKVASTVILKDVFNLTPQDIWTQACHIYDQITMARAADSNQQTRDNAAAHTVAVALICHTEGNKKGRFEIWSTNSFRDTHSTNITPQPARFATRKAYPAVDALLCGSSLTRRIFLPVM